MAQASWPCSDHNSRAVTDDEYERLAEQFSDDGLYGDPTGSPAVTAGTGLAVTVAKDLFASVRGHAWTSGTTDVTLDISANTSSSVRTDTVVLQLDRSTWKVAAVVVEGTPGSGPPALTRDDADTGLWEIPLADVTVIPSGTGVGVTRREQYVGSRVRPCLSTARPVDPARGEVCFETDTGAWRGWDGTAWKLMYSDSGQLSIPVAWTTVWEPFGVNIGRVVGNMVSLRISVRRIGETFSDSDPDGSQILTLPSALRPIGAFQYFTGHFTNGASVRVDIHTDGTVLVSDASADITVGRVMSLTCTYPISI